MSDTPTQWRIRRHHGNGVSDIIAEPLDLSNDEVITLNRAFCAAKSAFRVWPITPLAPLRKP